MSLVVFLKQDCETCKLVAPILESFLKKNSAEILCQDGSSFPQGLEVREDLGLRRSWEANIEIVPTLISFGKDGEEFLSAETIGSWSDTIHYEILACLNSKIPRKVV